MPSSGELGLDEVEVESSPDSFVADFCDFFFFARAKNAASSSSRRVSERMR